MSRKMQQTLAIALLTVPALLGGLASTVRAVTGRSLDVNPGTSTPNYIGDVTDFNSANGDYVTTNMFVGNWFGFEVAMTDATARNGTWPAYRLSIALKCSDNQYYSFPLTTFTTIQGGAEAVAQCGGFATTAVASAHWIYYE